MIDKGTTEEVGYHDRKRNLCIRGVQANEEETEEERRPFFCYYSADPYQFKSMIYMQRRKETESLGRQDRSTKPCLPGDMISIANYAFSTSFFSRSFLKELRKGFPF